MKKYLKDNYVLCLKKNADHLERQEELRKKAWRCERAEGMDGTIYSKSPVCCHPFVV